MGCRQVLPKQSLIRIVRNQDGVLIDLTGKAPGRGAYLHDKRSCWEAALQGPLARALRVELTPEAREALVAFMGGLADEHHG